MDSVLEIYEHCKAKSIDVSKLTVEDVEEIYTGEWPFWVILGDLHRKDWAAKNPRPKRRTRKIRKDTGRSNKRQTASAVFQSQLQAKAMGTLVERVNEGSDIEGSILVNNRMTGECRVIAR